MDQHEEVEADVTWWAVDDQFLDNKKTEQLYELLETNEDVLHCAMHIWLCAGVHSARNLTDGYVRESKLRTLSKASVSRFDESLAALETVGLLTRADGAIQMHDWDQCNPTRAHVLAKRARDAARKRGGADAIPRGVQADSGRAPNAPLPSPPLPKNSLSRTHAHESKDQGPDHALILEALEVHRHDTFGRCDLERLAEAVLATQVSKPVPIEWLVHAVHEAHGALLGEQASGTTLSAAGVTRTVTAFARRARAPQGLNAGQRGPIGRDASADEIKAKRAAEKAEADLKAQLASAKSPPIGQEARAANATNAKRLAELTRGIGRPIPPEELGESK